VDSLRADHLGHHGYGRDTSPFLDGIAEEAVVYENAFSNSSFTRESISTLFTGRLPACAGHTGWGARPSTELASMAPLFADAGYRTAFFSNSHMLLHPDYHRGFDVVEFLTKTWDESRAGPRLSTRALEFVRDLQGARFLMYLHYLDPHGPYEPGRQLIGRFSVPRPAKPLKLYGHIRPNLRRLVAGGFGPGDLHYEDLVARYDREIVHTDRAIRSLFEGLEELGVLDDTLVVVLADHGEEFLEHGFVEHAWTLHRESVHVPLLFWRPGVLPPIRERGPASVVDVLPTLVPLMISDGSPVRFDGAPLFSSREGSIEFRRAETPIIMESFIEYRSWLRAVVFEGWKYIAAQKLLSIAEREHASRRQTKLLDAYIRGIKAPPDPWGEVTYEALYDLTTDPGETRSLIDEESVRADEFRRILMTYRRRCQAQETLEDRRIPALSPEEIEQLERLGYLSTSGDPE
jgi:arylsulfatase